MCFCSSAHRVIQREWVEGVGGGPLSPLRFSVGALQDSLCTGCSLSLESEGYRGEEPPKTPRGVVYIVVHMVVD